MMKYRRRVNEVEAIKLSFNNMEDLKNIQDVLGEPFLNVDFSDVENPRLLVEDIHKNRKFTARFNKDYLVKSIDGKVYSVPNEVFEKVFEPIYQIDYQNDEDKE